MWTVTESPLGPLRLVAVDGALTAIDFLGDMPTGAGESRSTEAASLRADARPRGDRDDADPMLRDASRQLAAYFARDLKEFDLPLAPVGTPFQQRVWAELRRIAYGDVASYGEVAARLGMAGHAARAVGLANGRNPIPVVIPCHRVVGAGGRLTGYGGGMARKQTLLELEQHGLF